MRSLLPIFLRVVSCDCGNGDEEILKRDMCKIPFFLFSFSSKLTRTLYPTRYVHFLYTFYAIILVKCIIASKDIAKGYHAAKPNSTKHNKA